MPARVYDACFSPFCTNLPKERGWPAATFVRRGRGVSCRYEVDREMALDMIEMAELWAEPGLGRGSMEPEDSARCRVVWRWCTQARELLGAPR